MGYSRNIQTGDLEFTLPLKILDKKSFFTLGNSVKLCYNPWKCQGQKPRLMKIQQIFTLGNSKKLCNTLWSPLEIALLFQLTLRISTTYFSLPQEIPCPQPLENHVQNGPWLLHLLLSQFRFFCGISKQTTILISYGFYVLQHGWYMKNNSVAAMLARSRSCAEIYVVLIKTTSQVR